MDALTLSQQDSLNEFVVVTGVSLDDEDKTNKAIALLEYYNYDLNNSVLAFFDRGLELPVSIPEPQPEPIEQIGSHAELSNPFFASGVERFEGGNFRNLQGDFSMGHVLPRLPKAPRISNKWQLDLGIHVSRKAFRDSDEKVSGEKDYIEQKEKPKKLSILWIIFLVVPKTLSLLYSAFRFIFGLNFTAAIYDTPRVQFDYEAYDENFDVKKSLLSDEIISSYDITSENFNECHESSQQNFNFLLIVLCDDKSTLFAQNLLKNQDFMDLFSKNSGQFKETQIFINNVDKSPEAFEVATSYHRKRIPCIFLVGNVTRDPSVMSSMSVLYKANCSLGDEEEQNVLVKKVIRNLGRTLNDYNPQLVTKRFDKQEIEMSRLIKEKQDAAYLESLQSDKVKKIEKENQRKEEERQKKLSILRKGFIQNLISSKYFETQMSGVAANGSIRISIKLPDGRRMVQKFPKTAAMGEIYLFVETLLENPDESDNEVEAGEMTVTEFLDQFDFNFELFKPVPKCCLPYSTQTIEEFENLKSGDSVLFEYIDVDDDTV